MLNKEKVLLKYDELNKEPNEPMTRTELVRIRRLTFEYNQSFCPNSQFFSNFLLFASHMTEDSLLDYKMGAI